MVDLHNLNIQNKVEVSVNSLNEKRNSVINVSQEYTSQSLESLTTQFEDNLLITGAENENESAYFTETSKGLKCNFCPALYQREGHLRNHLSSKHNKSLEIKCGFCGKVFKTNVV